MMTPERRAELRLVAERAERAACHWPTEMMDEIDRLAAIVEKMESAVTKALAEGEVLDESQFSSKALGLLRAALAAKEADNGK